MVKRIFILTIIAVVVFGTFAFFKDYNSKNEKWVAVHLLNYTTDDDLDSLSKKLPELSALGVNLIFLEVDYSFEFKSHPELRSEEYITKEAAKEFAKACKKNGIRLIPEFQSLGHQSWADKTFPLLTEYPELDLTPGAFPENKNIYCREWDPTNPKVYQIVFPLIEEIVDAFDADGIHLGMDEVFLLGANESPSTKGMDPAKLYANCINKMYHHFGEEKGLEVFIWGDRLINGNENNYGEWEASMNGTYPAVDMISKDIIICDWHYNTRETYPSIPYFLDKGFRVLPTSYKNVEATEALIKYSFKKDNERMLGHLFTMWGAIKKKDLLEYPSLTKGTALIKSGKFFDVVSRIDAVNQNGSLQVSMESGDKNLTIYYTTNGTIPNATAKKYSGPITINETTKLKMAAFKNGEKMGKTSEKQYYIHLGIGKDVELISQASDKYWPMDGVGTLLNGVAGSNSYADGQWLAFEGENMEAIINLGKQQKLNKVALNTNHNPDNWVHAADKIEVFLSNDGATFTKAGEVQNTFSDEEAIVIAEVVFPEQSAHYVRIKAHHRSIPSGYPGEGNPAWLFVDEVIVD